MTPVRTTPLSGKRIVVTRSPDQAESMGRKLEALGAVPILFPAIQFTLLPAPELDNALTNLADYDWLLFTSANAVRFFFDRLELHQSTNQPNQPNQPNHQSTNQPNYPITQLPNYPITQSPNYPITQSPIPNYQLKIAAVGSATTNLLAEKGVAVDFSPDEFTGEQLALGLGDVRDKKILLPRARIGRPEIVNFLCERGAIVTDVALYDTVTAEPAPKALAELEKGVDVLTFTSPSSVRNFLKIVGQFGKLSNAVVACIGPSTATEAEANGLTVDVVPQNYTIDALINAVSDYYAS